MVPAMLMIGCEAWMREHPMGRWEELVKPMLGMSVDVVDGIGDREHQGFLEVPPEALPLLGWEFDRGSDQSSLHLTVMRASSSSHRSACVGRGLQVKVILPIFKDEKSKDAVTYHPWQWDVAIFHWSGWDDLHLLPYIFHSLQGFPGDLAKSLGEDVPLSDVLQMLDKDYGVIMTFDTLSKELYSLKQGSGENIAEFGVHLSQQVQILQSEYPGRIQPEHVEELKHDHFCEGLNPEYQQMLAHKVDGEHPASYSNVLLAAWKLERWAEAIDPPPPKTAVTSGLNMMILRCQGICFPHISWKATVLSLVKLQPSEMMRLRKIPVQSRKEKARQSLQVMKMLKKCQMEQEEQIIPWSISFASPRWLSYIKRRTGTALGVGALITSYETVWKTLANLPRKWI